MVDLNARVKFIWSMELKLPKEIVKERFIDYCKYYDNMVRHPTLRQKIDHRELFYKYTEYMKESDDNGRGNGRYE